MSRVGLSYAGHCLAPKCGLEWSGATASLAARRHAHEGNLTDSWPCKCGCGIPGPHATSAGGSPVPSGKETR